MIQGPEHFCCEETLSELGLFSLEKTAGDLVAAFQYLKGACRKDGKNTFSRACCNRTRSNGFKLREGRFRIDIRKKFFVNRKIFFFFCGETLEQISQRSSGGPIPGNIPGQVGQGSEQPGLVEDVPAHCRGVGLDDL